MGFINNKVSILCEGKNKTIKFSIICLILFCVLSYIFINPTGEKSKSEYHSSQLKQVITRNDSIVRIDYVDENDILSIGADTGYATKIITIEKGKEYEEYFDNHGNKVKRNAGYYGVVRLLDDKGNVIRISYVDEDGLPTIVLQGYATVMRQYNDDGSLSLEKYYDENDKPINTPLYGCGRIIEYYNNAEKITYIDEYESPMITKQGYAIIYIMHYLTEDKDCAHIDREFYYDNKNIPIALSLGQYGLQKKYNEKGQVIELTYLDSEGYPAITKKGYATIKRTYHTNDDSIATEMYYDINNELTKLAEGQYGITRENGKTIHLDRQGKQVWNIKSTIINYPRLSILFSIVLIILSILAGRKENLLLMVVYLGIICYFTLLYRDYGEPKSRLELFWSYKLFFINSETRSEIIKNIWLFIPMGAFLYKIYPKVHVILFAVFISVVIEIIQYYTGMGLCEFDDILSNGIGSFIGFSVGKIYAKKEAIL